MHWHLIRFIAALWNGTLIAFMGWTLITDGNISISGHGPETMAAIDVIVLLIGFGCSLALALKAQINKVTVAPKGGAA